MASSSDEQLAKRYAEKRKQGKAPTAAESKAYQRVIDARTLDQLRSVSPAFFCTLFGVQNKQRYDWEDRYQFPCGRGRQSIDVFGVINSIRKLIADNRKIIGTGSGDVKDNPDDIDIQEAKRQETIERRDKLKKQNEKLELELQLHRRELIPIEDVRNCFDMICNIWVRIAKQLQKSGHEAAWEICESHLTEANARFDTDIGEADDAIVGREESQ